TSSAATAITTLSATAHDMFVTVLDSSLIIDTLCFSVASNVPTPAEQNSLFVFPNPTHDEFTIESDDALMQVNCFDQVGRRVLSEDKIHASEIQLRSSELPEGIYFLEIHTAKEILYHRIIVVH